jgi:hypothetical protein
MRRGSLYDTQLWYASNYKLCLQWYICMIGFWWWTSLKASQATAFPADSALTGHIISYNLLVTLTTAGWRWGYCLGASVLKQHWYESWYDSWIWKPYEPATKYGGVCFLLFLHNPGHTIAALLSNFELVVIMSRHDLPIIGSIMMLLHQQLSNPQTRKTALECVMKA